MIFVVEIKIRWNSDVMFVHFVVVEFLKKAKSVGTFVALVNAVT